MTMDAMIKSLEKEGFAVKKEYLGSPVNAYEFNISKGDDHLVMQFKYPVDVGPKEKDNRQREFINRMTSEFNKIFGNKEVNNMNFRNDCMMLNGEATVHINGHEYPIRITDTRIKTTPDYYSPINVSFEADVLDDTYAKYCRYDVEKTRKVAGYFSTQIKDVIFNDPATIVLWKDGTKTVVKCGEDDIYDPEKGLTMAITKKLYGNKGSYYNEIKKWTDKYWEKQENTEPTVQAISLDVDSVYSTLKREIDKLYNKLNVSLVVDCPEEKDTVENVNRAIEKNLNEKDNRSPLQKAYDKVRDTCHNGKCIDLEEVLGYLGEALDD